MGLELYTYSSYFSIFIFVEAAPNPWLFSRMEEMETKLRQLHVIFVTKRGVAYEIQGLTAVIQPQRAKAIDCAKTRCKRQQLGRK